MRNFNRRWAAAISVFAAVVVSPAVSVAAPSGALNKTVTISFVSSGMATSAMGQQKSFNTSVQRIVYISSAGRLFMKHTASNGKFQRGGTFDPDNTSASHGGSFNFQGDKLVGVISYAGGARQITATFDPSFSSCTANIIEGAVGGKMQRKGPNGEMYTLTGVTTSQPSCSVQSGNAFAQ